MEDLTFGEQVKVVLSRKGMTIKGTCGDYRRKDRNENVQTESDAETGKRQFSGAGYADDRVDLRLSVSAEYFRRRIC